MQIRGILLVFLFLTSQAFAKNSSLASAYIQFQKGQYCGEVSRDDLKSAGLDCAFGKPVENSNVTSWAIYEWSVFQSSAERQIEKNNCMNEQLAALMKDESQLQTWYSQISTAWLGLKKSQLILDKCQSEVFNKMDLLDVKKFGQKKAYENSLKADSLKVDSFRPRKHVGDEWLNLCLDEEKMSALDAANTLFQHSVPIVSDPEFFKIMENNRDMVLNDKTGKPLSDQDILSADLQDLSFLKIKGSPQFDQAIKKSVTNLSNDRRSITKKILASKSAEGYDLSSDLKDYIFEDETLYQTMEAKNLLGDGEKMPTGSVCLLSKYEPNTSGEVFSLAAESLVAGGLVFKALKGTSVLKNLSKAGQIKKSLGYGAGVVGYPMIAKEIARSCPIPVVGHKTSRHKKFVSSLKNENSVAEAASKLPDEVGFRAWSLEVDHKLTPSCKTDDEKNLMLNKMYNSNCILDALLMVVPLKIALPVMLSGD